MNTTRSIDIFCHWVPRAYGTAALQASSQPQHMLERALAMPVMTDVDKRLRMMDSFPGYCQVPCLVSPPLEALASPEKAAELARLANDGMAEMAARHPDRFPGFFASLALNDPESMLNETRRAITELGACGVQIFTNMNGAPIDTPPFMELFALMAELDRPILLHPTLEMDAPDFAGEDYSKYELWWVLGWPYESSKAMYRLVFAGVFDRWPNLKIITHHGGGMIPMVAGRLSAGLAAYGTRTPSKLREKENTPLQGAALPAFKHFYADTATFGDQAGVECALKFFGPERILFASDTPFGPENGAWHIRSVLAVVNGLELNQAQSEGIFRGNAERLLKLKKNENASKAGSLDL
jgi:aminocarboxymuconate-semialdehyde decarboxylase